MSKQLANNMPNKIKSLYDKITDEEIKRDIKKKQEYINNSKIVKK